MRPRASVAWALLLIGGACGSRAGAAPTRATITVDGNLSDWTTVFANPANTSRDGDGSTLPCPSSTDRDCPVGGVQLDLARFAWTWSDTHLHVVAERQAARSGPASFIVYLDTNADGAMGGLEPVLQLHLSTGDVELSSYIASGLFVRDPLTDAQGWADGHVIPGSLVFGRTLTSGIGRSPDGRSMEAAVSWADLRLAPGSPVGFHVSTEGGGFTIADNMGGPGGGAGTTAYRAVSIAPERQASGLPGASVRLMHRVGNDGNVAATLDLSATSSCGSDVDYYLLPDTGGETWLGTDAGGNGDFSGPGDVISAQGDANADGTLDVGLVAGGDGVDVALEQQVALDSSTCELTVVVVQAEDASVSARVTDVVNAGSLTLAPNRDVVGSAGDAAWMAHVLQSNLAAATRVDVGVDSAFGWTHVVHRDPDGDGDPADAVALTDGDGSGLPDVALAPGETAYLLVRSDLPAAAGSGLVETALVRAIEAGSTRCFVLDRIAVRRPVTLTPDYLVDVGAAHHGGSGERVYFAHRIVNALGSAEAFTLQATSDQGWTVEMLSDPDRDGRPHDSLPLGWVTPPVSGSGGTFDFILAVDIPAGTLPAQRSRVHVEAAVQSRPAMNDEAWDDVVAAIVRAYEDPTHAVNASELPPCATVHALATGLTPSSSTLRFTWRDEAGLAVRVAPVASDASGACEDALVLPAAATGERWTVDVESFDGVTWSPLDRAGFGIVDPIVAAPPTLDRTTCDAAGEVLVAELELANTSFLLQPGPLTVRWALLSPDGALHRDATDVFTAYTGVEATRRVTVPPLAREEVRRLTLGLPAAAFPAEGRYRLEAWVAHACGPEALAGAVEIDVIDDADRDGLSRAEELLAGSDVGDADSDDDGVLDGDDGAGDSDGDGFSDAMDCDSDGDGLPDGLERGLADAGAATDVSAGCFRPDLDVATTTDEDVADTDVGGVPDGGEDRDRNGRRDAQEIDPLDGSDDVGSCSSAAPAEVTGLRVTRSGSTLRLSWDAASDPCTSHVVLASQDAGALTDAWTAVWPGELTVPLPPPPGVTYYAVQADSLLSGRGP